MLIPTFLASVLWLSVAFAERIFTIHNHCPQSITLYVNGQTQGVLEKNGFMNRTFGDGWNGFIYTDANGGNANGAGTTRAGFFGQTNHYYIIKDPKWFNTGVSISPQVVVNDTSMSLCNVAKCDNKACDATPPTGLPEPTASAPVPTLFECPGTSVGYTVTFCPEKTFPPPLGTMIIRSKQWDGQCLDVRGGIFEDGTPVQIYNCNGTPAQRWLITRGKIQLAGTPFCLDAGNSSIGTEVVIWTCS